MNEQLKLNTVLPEEEGYKDTDYVLDEKNYLSFQVHAGNLTKEGWSVLFAHLNRQKRTIDQIWERLNNGQSGINKITDRIKAVEETIAKGVSVIIPEVDNSGYTKHEILTQEVSEIVFVSPEENKKGNGVMREIFKIDECKYLGDVLTRTEGELLKLNRFGVKYLKYLKDYLKPHGLEVGCFSEDKHWQLTHGLIKR